MISDGRYKDVAAVVLENEVLRVAVIPGQGAKTASLVYKPRGRELLWQNPGKSFRRTGYGASYLDGEFSGFDEMFPTISECSYESPPWKGTAVPDHGEVWSLPWELETRGEEATLTVHGVLFPYRLSKTLRLEGACLQARYQVENLAPLPLEFIWAAHPLFSASEGMEFVVPPGMDAIVNSVPGPSLGRYGERLGFPTARLADGGSFDLSRVPARNDRGYQKYFFAGPVTAGWCLLYDPQSRIAIGLSYPREKVPYLGMWLNEGGFAGQYNIAPEPATAAMDRIDFSKMWGWGSTLGPRELRSWYLNIAVREGERPSGLGEDGSFL
jgi:galactose mutarotase-like enzyme